MYWKHHTGSSKRSWQRQKPNPDEEEAGTSTIMMKVPNFHEAMSWAMFHWQFETMADHNSSAAKEKAMHLLAILLWQAANNLYCVPTAATYDIIRVLKGRYRYYQLVVA